MLTRILLKPPEHLKVFAVVLDSGEKLSPILTWNHNCFQQGPLLPCAPGRLGCPGQPTLCSDTNAAWQKAHTLLGICRGNIENKTKKGKRERVNLNETKNS